MKQQAKKTTREKPSRDHYQEVTDKIIAALEAGTRHWQRPWDPEKASGPAMPFNAAIGHRYRGINTLLLGMSPFAFMSGDPRWCSYKQAAEKGWQGQEPVHTGRSSSHPACRRAYDQTPMPAKKWHCRYPRRSSG